jgi:hypothetical protein
LKSISTHYHEVYFSSKFSKATKCEISWIRVIKNLYLLRFELTVISCFPLSPFDNSMI